MENPTKETVIIVHGTWAEPKADNFSWYQIPPQGPCEPNFVSKLNKALARCGSPARCWAHCANNGEIFTWSGENAWIDRTQAALALTATLNKLQADGWRCHVIAHSHGGNVVAEALPGVRPTTDGSYCITGTITTLGTPFIDAMSPISTAINRRSRFLKQLAWAFYLITVLVLLWAIVNPHRKTWMPLVPKTGDALVDIGATIGFWFVPCAVLVALLVILINLWRRPRRKSTWSDFWTADPQNSIGPFILAISSPMDEAWQVLYHLRHVPNPLAPKLGAVAYLWQNHRRFIRRSREIARIEGEALFSDQTISMKIVVVVMWLVALAILLFFLLSFMLLPDADQRRLKDFLYVWLMWFVLVTFLAFVFETDFYLAMLAPVRWSTRQFLAISRIFYDAGTYIARRRSWSLLQELAFGLEGYGFQLPDATRVPTFANPASYHYEDLARDAEQRALAKRDKWVMRAFGDVAKTLSKMAAPDLKSLLEMIETDLSLVHAAYYTDDECIERVADWISGTTRT